MLHRIGLGGVAREQWLAMRRQYIGASEVAIICGEAAWG
jgi:predicted phage-related endonuclease